MTDSSVKNAMKRVAAALEHQRDHLTKLDQVVGDGDLGVTVGKIAKVLSEQAETEAEGDLGKFLISGAMAVNRAAPSTMGTLLATGLMRAGKEVRGKDALNPKDLAAMLQAADQGIQERGKAKPGDKTVLDALHPAAEAFTRALNEAASLSVASARMLRAAEAGRDAVTSKRSRVGRASWVGERTEGEVDPGCELLVVVLGALIGDSQWH